MCPSPRPCRGPRPARQRRAHIGQARPHVSRPDRGAEPLSEPKRACRYRAERVGRRRRQGHCRQRHAACARDRVGQKSGIRGAEDAEGRALRAKARFRLRPGGKHRHERSRQKHRPDAGEPALWRQNPLRRRVPLAGGERQKALPHARRRTGIRRTKGKPERAQARAVQQGCDRRATGDSGVVGGGAEVAGGDEVRGFRKRRASDEG